jgi:hypothetical protein
MNDPPPRCGFLSTTQDAAVGPMYTGICGPEIKKMIKARGDAGVHSTSNVRFFYLNRR